LIREHGAAGLSAGLLVVTFVVVGGAFGKIVVRLTSMVHAPSPFNQVLIIAMGVLLGGWIGASHHPQPFDRRSLGSLC
jgi:hypothetical protein